MSELVTLTAELKAAHGTGAARAVRRAGRVPAIVYGGEGQPIMVTVEQRVLERYLNQAGFYNRLFELAVDGTTERVIARDVQLHPVSDRPLHVDFLRIAAGTTITITIPVQFVNEAQAPGIRRGGMLNAVRHEIEVHCPADSIPDAIVVDLAGMQIGDSLHISQVTLPPNVQPVITDRDFTVATIAPPSGMTEEDLARQPIGSPAEVEATKMKSATT